eukprot:1159016-Pelagomonas_calceolata.AAC.2
MGVIFYQMLYGRRPFGEGMTQEALARQGVLLNATQRGSSTCLVAGAQCGHGAPPSCPPNAAYARPSLQLHR